MHTPTAHEADGSETKGSDVKRKTQHEVLREKERKKKREQRIRECREAVGLASVLETTRIRSCIYMRVKYAAAERGGRSKYKNTYTHRKTNNNTSVRVSIDQDNNNINLKKEPATTKMVSSSKK